MKAKKIILSTLAGALVGTSVFAEENVFSNFFDNIQPEVGLKVTSALGTGSEWSDSVEMGKEDANFGGGFGLFGHVSFGDGKVRYMNQIEADLAFNTGLGNSLENISNPSKTETYLNIMTLDIPVLFGLDIDVGERFVLTPYIGPYLSIPLTGTMTVLGNDSKLSFGGVTFGGTAGFTAAFKAGPGSVFMDGRYLYDFSGTLDLYHRSSIQGSIGYQMKL